MVKDEDALKCARCASDRVMPDLTVMDWGRQDGGGVGVLLGQRNPDALIFKGSVDVQLRATICGVCGHTSLSVAEPAKAYQVWLQMQAARKHRDP